MTAGANHPTSGVSTFPFAIFGGEWRESTLDVVMIVGGNPARPIKRRYDDADVERLLRVAGGTGQPT